MVCALALLAALAGCASEPQGPTDREIQAEMQGLLNAFQRTMKAAPDEAPRFFPADRLRDFMGSKAFRYREMGTRMLADGTWKTGDGGPTVYVGVTLVRMASAEGATQALAAETEGFTDAAPLAGGIVPRRADRTLAFAHGPYVVTLSDLGETASAPSVLRKAAETMAESFKDVAVQPRGP
jgi:hypothetical protein